MSAFKLYVKTDYRSCSRSLLTLKKQHLILSLYNYYFAFIFINTNNNAYTNQMIVARIKKKKVLKSLWISRPMGWLALFAPEHTAGSDWTCHQPEPQIFFHGAVFQPLIPQSVHIARVCRVRGAERGTYLCLTSCCWWLPSPPVFAWPFCIQDSQQLLPVLCHPQTSIVCIYVLHPDCLW